MPILGVMKQKKSSIGCLFWIALILLILVIFLFSRDTIQTVLDNTKFLDLFSREEAELDIERTEESAPEPMSEQDNEQTLTIEPDEEEPVSVEVVTIDTPEAVDENQEADDEHTEESEEPAPNIRRSRLYFIKVDEQGNISLKGIIRPVYYRDSPLTETLMNLMKGLSTTEMNQGLLSLIPDSSVLRSVAVKDNTAFLNFSDDFLFNSFGQEGYNAQLQQIVYTTLEFSTIEQVQILIDGQKKDYMGTEGGLYIGQPLTKDSF